ncbi:proto-oncogene tyrosine-protein kinase ROS-like isoform X3 [Dysidea avara]|uniref:proto-oncogene tyrosine-protein kinase ROS-like isoform X3 n=1 Tax=Dysidea avara TaxID=196820 RepID=UPI0033222090
MLLLIKMYCLKFPITCLLILTSLDFFVSRCSAQQCQEECTNNTSGWSSLLLTTLLDNRSVMVNWQPNTTDDLYIVQYQLNGSVNYTMSYPVNATTYTITELTGESLYEVRVCLDDELLNCGNCELCFTTPTFVPSQIEQSSVSVYKMERNSNQLSVLFTWAGLNLEQAGGVLLRYVVSIYITHPNTGRRTFNKINVSADDVLLVLPDLPANQEYSFTVRGVNRAGSGEESEEITFNTNASQPPMELLATGPGGVVNIIRNVNQSNTEEAGFGNVFTTDNRNYTVYYTDCSKVLATSLRNPQHTRLIANTMIGEDNVVDITFNWVTRVLYLAVNDNGTFSIWSLPIDNSVFDVVYTVGSLSNDSVVSITIAPFTGLLYWIEASDSFSTLNQLDLISETVDQLYNSNSVKRNVMCMGGIGSQQLTAALTYDPITDRIWVSTVTTGHIWSCDLTGCNCTVEVNATTLVAATNGASVMSDVGLPANSISLDNVNIYWSSSSGVFSVPRDDTTTLSQLSNTTTSSLVTIDPGQQPLPERTCLYPALDTTVQPQAECINATNSTLLLRWSTPRITEQCRNQIVTYPTINYTVMYRKISSMDSYSTVTTFDEMIKLTDLKPFTEYLTEVLAGNIYTGDVSGVQLIRMKCTTQPNVLPGPVVDVKVFPQQTSLNVTWKPPLFTMDEAGRNLMYRLLLQPRDKSITIIANTSDTHLQFINLQPSTHYIITISPDVLGAVITPAHFFTQTFDIVSDPASVIIASDVGIYSNPVNDIRTTNLITNDNTTGVAYDSHRNIFYWAIDGGATRLQQLTFGATALSELSLVANPSSVALDYIGQRLYWIENSNTINFLPLATNISLPTQLVADEDITDIAVDSPNGLLFWAHNGQQSRGISAVKLNGLGGRIMCTSGTSVQYLAIALDTVTMRIFWITEMEGSFELGVAHYDYKSGSCFNIAHTIINIGLTIDNLFARLSMTYVVGSLFFTSSAQANTVYIGPSNFSSAPANYQLAFGCYNVYSGSSNAEIRAITSNQTSQQFLPDGMDLGDIVEPPAPRNLRLDNSSTPTLINITWDRSEGISPAIVAYQLTYSLSRLNGSSSSDEVLTSDNYYVLENQSPETTLNISVRAFTRWYSSGTTEQTNVISPSRLPSQIEQSSVSVYRMERNSEQLSVLFTWAGLNLEQAGGVLLRYVVTLNQNGSMFDKIEVGADDVLLVLSDLTPNQEYSFTVRGVNRAGSGEESEEITFNTNAPQPPMELLATGPGGVVNIIRNVNQSNTEEAGFGEIFAVSNYTVYYVESSTVFGMPLRNPQHAFLLSDMAKSLGDVIDVTYDWITRVLYISVATLMVETDNSSRTLNFWRLPIDNPVFEPVYTSGVLFNDSVISMTVVPFRGYLYWIEAREFSSTLNQLNLLTGNATQLYNSNSVKRNVMCMGGIGSQQLTTALTYDPIIDRIWVSTVTAGHIWSCDLTGCNCIVEVNATTLVAATNGASVMSDVGLPANSISLDNVNIYWSSSSGVFSVPRDDTTTLSQLSNTTTSSLVTIDPGQQPLPERDCLYPPISPSVQPKAECFNATDSTIFLRWFAPNILMECTDQLVAFPTLNYEVTYRIGSMGSSMMEMTFDRAVQLTGLYAFSEYRIQIRAQNSFTVEGNQQPQRVSCFTMMGMPSMVRNLNVTAHGTELLFVTWTRPLVNGSDDAVLSYTILVDGQILALNNDSNTSIPITGLSPNTSYTIKVFANNSQAVGEAVQVVGTTWPLPPIPMVIESQNTSIRIRIPLTDIYEPLENLSLIVTSLLDDEVVVNDSIPIEEPLQPHIRTIISLTPNTQYAIRTYANYMMTGYNADELLSIFSNLTTTRTLDGVPDVPVVRLVNSSVIIWNRPTDNGEEITNYVIRIISDSGVVNVTNLSATNLTDIVTYDMMSLMLPTGLRANISVRAINSIGSSEYSDPVPFMIPSPQSSSSSSRISGGVMAGIIACILAGIFLIVLTMVLFTCCCRSRSTKMDFYDFRVNLPYNNDLRVLRMSQMRMANNDLYMCDYSEEDLETLRQFPCEKITLDKELGRGAFGEVWAGTAEDIMGPGSGTHHVALKMLQKNAAEVDKRSFLSEALVMSNFSHPNVLPVLGVCLDSNPFFLILELMEAGDLLAFLRGARQENGPPLLTLPELVKIAFDVANGARYLETQHFVHRDLAARNCLVSSKGPDRVVKIGDFGLARDVYHSDYYRKEGQGLLPVRWMAPESLLDGKFTVDSDIWSYGIVLWEITTLGRQPYPARSNQEVFQFIIAGRRCDRPDNCHPKLWWLMKNCWAHRPEDRPRFRTTVDTLTRLHDRLTREGSVISDQLYSEESEEDYEYGDDQFSTNMTNRNTVSNGRSLRSSIRSGASFIATGIATLTRSSRLMNSIRHRASLRQCAPNGIIIQNSTDNLPESKDQNGFREVGPF